MRLVGKPSNFLDHSCVLRGVKRRHPVLVVFTYARSKYHIFDITHNTQLADIIPGIIYIIDEFREEKEKNDHRSQLS